VPAVACVDWHNSTVAGTAELVTPSKLMPHSKIETGWFAPAITLRTVFAPAVAANAVLRATKTASIAGYVTSILATPVASHCTVKFAAVTDCAPRSK
jgi:hypothetical protein